jgi:DNA-binding NarL/FixJ family response regulator
MNDYYTFDYSNIYLPYEPFETDFTKKEIEVIKEICKGKDNEKISKALKVSTNTVDTHRKSIYIKAGVRSGVQLMLFAMVTGIVSPFEVTSLSLNIYRE